MKKHEPTDNDEMLPEYDFFGKQSERGKYYQAYRQGYTVKIKKEDGTIEKQTFTPEKNVIELDTDDNY